MAPPSSFGPDKVRAFQAQIDHVLGTTKSGKSIIRLAWAPSELRWRPHVLGDDVPGYTFPIFFYGWDEDGREIAAPRWVLLERNEPEQYSASWEQGRYSVREDQVWDWKGPCPAERYIELWRHGYHDGSCCPCYGAACKCVDTDDCWGLYAEPNRDLLARIERAKQRLKDDSDVQPLTDAKDFSAPNEQRESASRILTAEQAAKARRDDFSKEIMDYWLKQPRTVSSGLKRTESGLYLLN